MLGNLQAALSEIPRPGASRKLSGKEEVPLLVATACSKPPDGRARWMELLAGKLVSLTQHDSFSGETVRPASKDHLTQGCQPIDSMGWGEALRQFDHHGTS